MNKMNKLLVILGSTSTGKTDLALKLAKKFNGELISADSRQVYKGLDIGTGKLPSKYKSLLKENNRWIIDRVSVHMYDVVSPAKQYNVSDFAIDTKKMIDRIYKKDKLPILVGGTGLYIKAIVDNMSNLSIPQDKKLREKLEKLTTLELQDILKELSLESWKEMNNSDRQNPRRLMRRVELAYSGINYPSKLKTEYNVLKIGLIASRETLYKRSDERVIKRIKQGLISEAEKLNKEGLSLKRMRQLGLEYGILADYLEGRIKDKKDLIKILQFKIHSYTKRQQTWFKKEKNVNWFDISKKDLYPQVEKLVSLWYDSTKEHAAQN